MLWLTWQMWILLALAFAGGMIAGWIARGASDEVEAETSSTSHAAAAPPAPPRPSEPEKPADAPPGPAPTAEIAPESAVDEDAPKSDAPQETAQEDLTAIRGLGPKAAATLIPGVVFSGSMDGHMRAYDVETGDELWKARLPAGGQATPMGYRVSFEDGTAREYVVIAAGGHGRAGTTQGDHLVAFALEE